MKGLQQFSETLQSVADLYDDHVSCAPFLFFFFTFTHSPVHLTANATCYMFTYTYTYSLAAARFTAFVRFWVRATHRGPTSNMNQCLPQCTAYPPPGGQHTPLTLAPTGEPYGSFPNPYQSFLKANYPTVSQASLNQIIDTATR